MHAGLNWGLVRSLTPNVAPNVAANLTPDQAPGLTCSQLNRSQLAGSLHFDLSTMPAPAQSRLSLLRRCQRRSESRHRRAGHAGADPGLQGAWPHMDG
jgi:hypothetical protein